MGNPLYFPNGKGDEDHTDDRERYRDNFDKISFGETKDETETFKRVRKTVNGKERIVYIEKNEG